MAISSSLRRLQYLEEKDLEIAGAEFRIETSNWDGNPQYEVCVRLSKDPMRAKGIGRGTNMPAEVMMQRKAVAASALVLSLVGAEVILGQRTGSKSQSPCRKAAVKTDGITTASFYSPSREYIYAGLRLSEAEETFEKHGYSCAPSE